MESHALVRTPNASRLLSGPLACQGPWHICPGIRLLYQPCSLSLYNLSVNRGRGQGYDSGDQLRNVAQAEKAEVQILNVQPLDTGVSAHRQLIVFVIHLFGLCFLFYKLS
jgi:hypothetical protein